MPVIPNEGVDGKFEASLGETGGVAEVCHQGLQTPVSGETGQLKDRMSGQRGYGRTQIRPPGGSSLPEPADGVWVELPAQGCQI
jgi:hypothetical protein